MDRPYRNWNHDASSWISLILPYKHIDISIIYTIRCLCHLLHQVQGYEVIDENVVKIVVKKKTPPMQVP